MLLWLLAAGALAGWIDAVVGGGGLIQLPALLGVPGSSGGKTVPSNRPGGRSGWTAPAQSYPRRVSTDWSAWRPASASAFRGAVCGAKLATLVPSERSTPIVLRALIGG